MAKKFSELRAKMSPERRARNEAAVKAELRNGADQRRKMSAMGSLCIDFAIPSLRRVWQDVEG